MDSKFFICQNKFLSSSPASETIKPTLIPKHWNIYDSLLNRSQVRVPAAPLHVRPWASCSHTCSFGWCLAEGYGNGDQRRPMGNGPLWLGKNFSILATERLELIVVVVTQLMSGVWTACVEGRGASRRTQPAVAVVRVLSVWQSLALCARRHDWRSSLTERRRQHCHRRPHVTVAGTASRALHWWSTMYAPVHYSPSSSDY